MKYFLHLWLAVLTSLAMLTPGNAETRYVSDVLVVTVRSQKGNTYDVLETLVTATPVEILAEDKTFVKVKTPKGTEGYILKQYITRELPKARQIKQLKNEVAGLQQQLEQLRRNAQEQQETAQTGQAQIEALTAQLSQSSQQLEQVETDYRQLLQDSENVINLGNENEQLREQNTRMNSELLVLREENQSFHRSNMIRWFLAGGGVFFGGWVIGKISRGKKRSYSRL